MNARRLRFCAILLTLPTLAPAATPVVQLRGTIANISSSGSKSKSEASFELSANDEKFSLRVIEANIQPALAGYYESNLHDIFASAVGVAPDGPHYNPLSKMPSLASFRPGSVPASPSAPRAQVLAYAHLAARLPKNGEGDARFAEVVPQLVAAAGEMEKSELRTQVLRRPDGSLDRVNFWGQRPGTELKTFENTKETFLLASLVLKKISASLPVDGVFTVFGKRPSLTGKLVSFERRRFEFGGTIGLITGKAAFGGMTYYPESAPTLIVIDHRFLEEDGGKARSYALTPRDALPFAREALPPWRPVPTKPTIIDLPTLPKKPAP